MILWYLALCTQRLGVIFWVFESCFPIVSFTFYPDLHYGPSHKTTLRPRDLMFASTYFIWTGSVHWWKYGMSSDLHFLRISRNRIMLSPFGLLALGPRSEIDDADELRLSRAPLLVALTCSYWGIPPTLA